MQKIITFVTYESPWFPAGGIAAVMGQLPTATATAASLPTVVITPLHGKSPRIAALEMQQIGVFQLPYDRDHVQVAVLQAPVGCPWYFLQVAPRSASPVSFFEGTRHPYDVPRDVLLRDALVFGAATVQALPVIATHRHVEPAAVEWHLMAQDWEAATALLAFGSQRTARGRLHLTLHNSYDEFATPAELATAGIDATLCPGDTILHRALSLIEPPAFTVSEQFAQDLTEDLLQREVMAPHLQPLLHRATVVGVDNGPFKTLAVDAAALCSAALGDFGTLQEWKGDRRHQALTALAAHTPTAEEPLWGDQEQFRRADAVWFVMAGRDDPRQKGYDIAAAAVEDYLVAHYGEPDCAQFLFFPIPGDEGLPGLGFLQVLAERFPQDVAVFPFIWAAGFTAALQGAAYGLMPSLYEPFGMANELYLAGGCVSIGRATGGNLEQIVPLRAAAAYSRAVQVRCARYHALSAQPTGILWREKDDIASARHDWGGINGAQYDKTGGSPSRVEQRRGYAVFREMARELRLAIEDGIRLYRQAPASYYRMVAAGIGHIERTFAWQRAGQEYARKIG
jgi:glycogen synthase